MNQENQNVNNTQETNNQNTNQTNTGSKPSILNDVKDDSDTFTQQEKEDGKLLAILSYLWILGVVFYFVEKNNQFVRYHAKQATNLLIIEVIVGIAVGIISGVFSVLYENTDIIIFTIFSSLISLAVSGVSLVLMILGIMNAANGKAKELPVVGKFKIIK